MVGVGFVLAALAAFGILRHATGAVIVLAGFVYLCTLMVSIALLLDYPRLPRQPRASKRAKELASQGLLACTHYRADRAFRVKALHGEGPHYFLELETGGVLHLSGLYLCEYEPSESGVRHFPCTQFTIRRHAGSGDVIDILCEGLVIEPENEAPPFTPEDFAQSVVPADGEVLYDLNFDQLRQQLTNTRSLM